jgi:hypothetical protein
MTKSLTRMTASWATSREHEGLNWVGLTRLTHDRRTAGFGVRRDKAALFQWVQAPPGEPASRKQPEQEETKCLGCVQNRIYRGEIVQNQQTWPWLWPRARRVVPAGILCEGGIGGVQVKGRYFADGLPASTVQGQPGAG